MACGAVNSAERVQPSIIGSLVRLVEPRPRAQSSTHAAPRARGSPYKSEHDAQIPAPTRRDASAGKGRDDGVPPAADEVTSDKAS